MADDTVAPLPCHVWLDIKVLFPFFLFFLPFSPGAWVRETSCIGP